MWESRVRQLGIVLLALLAFGCASVAPEPQSSRVLRDQPFSAVFATAMDALADLGAQPVTVRSREAGGVLTARVRTAASPPTILVVEVTVVASDEGVWVAVTAEPADQDAHAPGIADSLREEASRQGCSSCPSNDPLIPAGSGPRDNPLVLSESRKLVQAYLAALDRRLR